MGRRGISLKTRVGQQCSISQGGGADCTVEVYLSEEYEEESQCYK